MNWTIHHRTETASTNIDALAGRHGDVFTADYQTAGRGRLDHKWLSPPAENLMMSAVLSVEGAEAEDVAALALVAGLATAKALRRFGAEAVLKWPNDVLAGGRKLAGLLCRRNGDLVVVGIGVNVRQRMFAPEIADRAASLASLGLAPEEDALVKVRDAVLDELGGLYRSWREGGFAAVYPEIREFDFLRGRAVAVVQTDDGAGRVSGVSSGIAPDGALDVGGVRVYAGEAHVEQIG